MSIVEASPRQDAAVMAETAGSPGADGQKVRMFDTPVNSLTEGLATFQTQTGIKVVIDPARAEGVQVPAVTGRMTLEQALLRHMSHTTYPIRFTAADVATVGLAIAEFVEVSGRALPRSARPVLTDPLEPAS